MKVFCVANQKGGVGKSTTADALAAYFKAEPWNLRVLAIDLDSQCNLTWAHGIDPNELSVTVREVLSGEADIKKAIVKGRVDIIPASAHVAVTDDMFGSKRKERRLKKLLSELEDDYDVVVLDTPPALGLMSVNALVAADVLVIPGQADPFTLKGIEEIFKTAQIVKEGPNPDLIIGGVVITRHNPRINIARQALEVIGEIAQANGTKVFGTCIRECTALKEAQAMEKSIFEYAPRSNAAKDYRKVFDELMEGLNNDGE